MNPSLRRRSALMVRIRPDSPAFTLLLGLLASLPTFGIDMVLPTLAATGAALRAPPSATGLVMSVYLLTLGSTLLVYGPASDRYGRKPVALFGCALLAIASIGCAASESLPALLVWRAIQGAGAAGPATAAITIVRDLFDGEAARTKMASVVFAINAVPMIAPMAGAALLGLWGWRAIYLVPAVGSLVLLLAMAGFVESASIEPTSRLRPYAVARNYLRVLAQPACLGNILCNAGAAGAVFAYIAGSPLLLISALGLSPVRYGLIFGASSLSVMCGAFANQRLRAWGVSPDLMLAAGLLLSMWSAAFLLIMTLAGWTSIPVVLSAMIGVALAFGLISPNAMHGAMQPLPQIAGAVSAAVTFIQLIVAAASSALVAALFDGHSARSMAGIMLAFSLLAAASYLWVVRLAEPIAYD